MGICCCLLGPQTSSYQAEVLLIEHLSSANRTLPRNGVRGDQSGISIREAHASSRRLHRTNPAVEAG